MDSRVVYFEHVLKATAQGAKGRKSGLVGAAAGLVLPIWVAVARLPDRDELYSEDWLLSDLTFIALLVAPPLLALVALQDRPIVFLSAAILTIPMGLVFYVFGILMFIAAACYLAAFIRWPDRRIDVRGVIAAFAAIACVAGGGALAFANSGRICSATATPAGGVSREVCSGGLGYVHLSALLVLVVAALVISYVGVRKSLD